MSAQWLDKSDFVAAWQSETLASVVFCNADCLPELKNIDGKLLTPFSKFQKFFKTCFIPEL